MDVLIIGLSNIVSRRVLPALRTLPSVGRIDVATHKATDPAVRSNWTYGDVYDDYTTALTKSKAELAYVSLVNSEHEPWARAALEHGRHVVVDKPAFLGLDRTERMLELAAKQDRCLAEATVFGYHPQIAALMEAFAQASSAPTRISALFTFPPFEPGNFRYAGILGGGALWDVGPYAVATGRIFFGVEPSEVQCSALAYGGEKDDVEIAFSALQVFPEGRSLVGHFGFDGAYCNRLTLVGPGVVADVDRIFTTPPDLASSARISTAGGTTSLETPPADAFACFLDYVLACIARRDWSGLAHDLGSDARTLHRLRQAAGLDRRMK